MTLEAEIADLIKTAGATLRGEAADTGLDADGPERERAAWDADIRILETDKIAGPASSSAARTTRAALVAGALALTLVLGWIGGWTARGPIGAVPSPAAADQHAASPAQIPPSDARTVATDTARAAEPPRHAKLGVATARRIDGSTTTGSAGRRDGAYADTKAKAAPAAQPNTASAAASVTAPRRPKTPTPTPFPETKPTTIDGWVVREVTNGTAVLQGPNGVWNAKRGDNVPGLGTVDSIVMWGSRWIVSTSRGLVATQ